MSIEEDGPIQTHYETLGVSESAKPHDIKRAYRKAARKSHPDGNNGNADQFKSVNEAYKVLYDGEQRKKYDEELTVDRIEPEFTPPPPYTTPETSAQAREPSFSAYAPPPRQAATGKYTPSPAPPPAPSPAPPPAKRPGPRPAILTALIAGLVFVIIISATLLHPPKKPIDVAPSSVVDVIAVGGNPVGVAVAPNGKQVYVTNHEAILVIDTANRSVSHSVAGSDYPSGGVAFTQDGSRAYVTHYGSASVSVIDTASGSVVDTIDVSWNPSDIAISAVGSRAYVILAYSVSVIDTANHSMVDTINLEGNPYGVSVSPDGRHIYVATHTDWNSKGRVLVIDTESLSVADTITVEKAPGDIALTPDGSRAYVTHGAADQVSVIDLASNSVDETITTGYAPMAVAMTSDGSLAYVTNYGSDSVSVIDTGTNSIVDTISTGDEPGSIAVALDGHYAYVTHYDSGLVSVIAIGGAS